MDERRKSARPMSRLMKTSMKQEYLWILTSQFTALAGELASLT